MSGIILVLERNCRVGTAVTSSRRARLMNIVAKFRYIISTDIEGGATNDDFHVDGGMEWRLFRPADVKRFSRITRAPLVAIAVNHLRVRTTISGICLVTDVAVGSVVKSSADVRGFRAFANGGPGLVGIDVKRRGLNDTVVSA